jgi:hypothetical protein
MRQKMNWLGLHNRILHFILIESQLDQVADGLDYLRQYGVVHGDLKGVSRVLFSYDPDPNSHLV